MTNLSLSTVKYTHINELIRRQTYIYRGSDLAGGIWLVGFGWWDLAGGIGREKG